MAFPWAAVAGGVAQAGFGSASINSSRQENNWARNFADSSMEKSHRWALEDWALQNDRDDMLWNRQNAKNLELWNMQNAYNSPQAQMERFEAAGLNRNLIYGQQNQGAGVNTADYNPSPVRNTTNASPSYGHPADFSRLGDIVNQVMAVRQGEANIDLTHAQAEATRKEAAYKDVVTLLTRFNLDQEAPLRLKGMQQDYEYRSGINPLSTEALRLTNKETEGKISHLLQSIIESQQRVSASRQEQTRENSLLSHRKLNLDMSSNKMEAETGKINLDTVYQELINNATKAGVNMKDNLVFRLLEELVHNITHSTKGANKWPTYNK